VTAACAYQGWVRHRRFAPVEHAFRYPLLLVYLDLDELPARLGRWPRWLASFRRADYLGDPDRPLRDEVLDLVEERTGARPDGPVRLLTQLRHFGFAFNPVSFYFCFDGDRVAAVAAEVTNTPWRERHVYLLERSGDVVDKAFHVSPFLGMDGEYEWRVSQPGEALSIHIEHRSDERRVFDATLSLRRRELTGRLLARHPAGPLAVATRIYLQALRLKLKGAPHFPHPAR
jgi:uncharacterized protein